MASTQSSEAPTIPMADINVTPMADVMLVLLIVFMITAPLAQHKVKVDLPEAVLLHQANKPVGAMDLAVKDNGLLFLDEAMVGDDELKAKLAVVAQRTPQPELQIRADKTVPYSRIWEIMQSAKSVGMIHLGFVTTGEDKKNQ